LERRVILHVDVDVAFNGILNVECAVLPFGRHNDAIPDDATTIMFSDAIELFDNGLQ